MTPDKEYVYLEAGVHLKSEVSSFEAKCAICSCEGGK